jgi:hypothetical protein
MINIIIFAKRKSKEYRTMKKILICMLTLLLLACNNDKQHYYQSIISKADSLNQAYMDMSKDTALMEAAKYYDGHGNINERIRAYYQLGSMYRDRGDAPMALNCYSRAASFAEDAKRKCDLKLLGRLHGQMACIYGEQHLPDKEMQELTLAEKIAWEGGDTLMAITAYNERTDAYFLLNNSDSVLSVSLKASQMYEKYGYKSYAAGSLFSAIAALIDRHDYEQAGKYLKIYEQYSGFFDKNGEITGGHEIYYYNKGRYYEGVGQTDSAQRCYRKLLSYRDINDVEGASKGLLSVYKKKGNADSIAKYADLYCRANDSSNLKHSADEVLRMKSLYDYSEYQQKAIDSERSAKNYSIAVILLVVGVLLASYLGYLYIRKSRKKAQRKLIEQNEKYNNQLEALEKSKQELAQIQEGFDKYKEEKKQEISRLQQTVAEANEEPLSLGKEDAEEALRSSIIVKALHANATSARSKTMTEQQLEQIETYVRRNIPAFIDEIEKREHRLNKREMDVCIFIRLRFLPSEICILLGITSQVCSNIRAHINKKMFNESGTTNLNRNIITI